MNEKSYKDWRMMSDTALNKVMGEFVKYHRLHQNKTQQEVAKSAGISRSTLSLLERGESVSITTLLQVLRVLDLLDIMDVFKIHKQISPLQVAKMEQEKRQRASSKKKTDYFESEW